MQFIPDSEPGRTVDLKALNAVVTPPKRQVIDATSRMFHWLFAFCFLGAYITAESETFRLVHVTLGYTMAGLFVFRILWGCVGPQSVRLSALLSKLSSAPDWLRTLLAVRRPSALWMLNWKQGQNLLMSVAIVFLLVLVIPLTLTGYATYHEWGFRWLQKMHESIGEFYLFIVFAHLGLVVLLSLLRRKNLAMQMMTGQAPGPGPDLVRRSRGVMAILLAAAVLSWWGWSLITAL
jgi:cytochrome b